MNILDKLIKRGDLTKLSDDLVDPKCLTSIRTLH